MSINQQKKGIEWTWSKIVAILLLILIGVSPILVYFSLDSWFEQNNELQKPRDFHIVYGADLPYDSKLKIDLTINYPRSILVVEDRAIINGLIVVENPSPDFEVLNVSMGFENALSYPIIQDDGVTLDANFTFTKVEDFRFTGNTNLTWSVEGEYRTIFRIKWRNSTGEYIGPQVLCENMEITVYPKSELAQIVNNNTSMIMTLIFYVLTLIGTGSLILSLWDRKPCKDTNNNGNNSNDEAHTEQVKTESEQKIKSNSTNKKDNSK